jgi:NAD(P)-dependent dehydrogenase (short-subunit alcohol dehydrogenase family)
MATIYWSRRPKPAAIRRSTSSTATSSAGGGSGRGWRPTSGLRALRTRAGRRRSSRNWRIRGPTRAKIAAKYDLAEADLCKLASAWHTDLDLGREIEQPNDIAPAVVFLASADSAWTTGETLYISGGLR